MECFGRSISIPTRILKNFNKSVEWDYGIELKPCNIISAFMHDFVWNHSLAEDYVKHLEKLARKLKDRELKVETLRKEDQ